MTTKDLYQQADNGDDGCKCGWLQCRECFPTLNHDVGQARRIVKEINK